MNLLVSELDHATSLKQAYPITRDTMLYSLRPHLYIQGAPAGSLFIEVQDANGRKIGVSETLAIAALRTAIAALGYDHGYFNFLCSVNLKANTSYLFELKSTGYTYSGIGSAHVGWVGSPAQLQFWHYQQPVKGVA